MSLSPIRIIAFKKDDASIVAEIREFSFSHLAGTKQLKRNLRHAIGKAVEQVIDHCYGDVERLIIEFPEGNS